MKTILHVQASARSEGSITRAVSAHLIGRLSGGASRIITRDLAAEPPSFVTAAHVEAYYTPAEARSEAQREVLAESDALVAELVAADIVVIASPMYNFTVPAALKAWLDLVCRAGETFRFKADGTFEGLLTSKRAYVVAATGGTPVGSAWDHLTPYLRQILGFMGITDVSVVAAAGSKQTPAELIAAACREIDLQLARDHRDIALAAS